MRNYYSVNFPQLNAAAKEIRWDVAEDSDASQLPKMVSDITLTDGKKTLILDAKFYGSIMQEHYEKHSYRNAHLNQVVVYAMSDSAQTGRETAAMLLYAKTEEEITLEVRNIDPAERLQKLASGHAGVFLISGTLSPVSSYKRYYFGDMPVETLSLPNSFPKENRMVIAAEDITTAFSQRQNGDNTERIAESILAFSHLRGNLAVYFPSYQLQTRFADLCAHRIRSKVVYVEPRESSEANEALKEFISLPSKNKSGILFGICGGKWSEGLDYRGDQLTAAMVIGLPLAPFTPVRRLINSYYKRKFGPEGEFIAYTLPAINKSMQALGRVLRTETDRGVLILGDERFTSPEIFRGIPPWMQQEMKKTTADGLQKLLSTWSR
mgnify:CR=1 FL=1